MEEKAVVEIFVGFSNGYIQPIEIKWLGGRCFEIDKILRIEGKEDLEIYTCRTKKASNDGN